MPISSDGVDLRGASWADDGTIFFGSRLGVLFGEHQGGSISRIPSAGGTAETVVEVPAGQFVVTPQLLPGGEWLLFTVTGHPDAPDGQVVAESLVTGTRVVLIEDGRQGRWLPTGHLVYLREQTLFAVAFDPAVMEPPAGPGVAVIEEVGTTGTGEANLAVSESGAVAYLPARAFEGSQLVWVDRRGLIEPLPFAPTRTGEADLSPDGRQIALDIRDDDGRRDIWIYDTDRGGSQVRLTTEGDNRYPEWSPDGDWIYFSSDRGEGQDIWRQRADRSGDAELVLDLELDAHVGSISPDGATLLFSTGRDGDHDLGSLALDGEQETIVLATDANESSPEFSPDGRFYAFTSNETGQNAVYAREVATGRTYPVSTSVRGGGFAHWSPDGTEIFHVAYRGGPGILVSKIETDPFTASEPLEFTDIRRWFLNDYAVSADGQRLLVLSALQDPSRIRVILNWFDELNRRVPTGR